MKYLNNFGMKLLWIKVCKVQATKFALYTAVYSIIVQKVDYTHLTFVAVLFAVDRNKMTNYKYRSAKVGRAGALPRPNLSTSLHGMLV